MFVLQLEEPYKGGGRYGRATFSHMRITNIVRSSTDHTVHWLTQYGNVVDGEWEAPRGLSESHTVKGVVPYEQLRQATVAKTGEHPWDAEERTLMEWICDGGREGHIAGTLMELK